MEAIPEHFEIPTYQIEYWNPYHPTLRRRPMCGLLTVPYYPTLRKRPVHGLLTFPLLSYPQEEAHQWVTNSPHIILPSGGGLCVGY